MRTLIAAAVSFDVRLMQNIGRFTAETVGRNSPYHGARRANILTTRKTNLCRRENRNSPLKRVI